MAFAVYDTVSDDGEMSTKRIQQPITVTLPPDFIARINRQKQRETRSASEIVREALRAYYGIGSTARLAQPNQ